jgi:hypothetical protein
MKNLLGERLMETDGSVAANQKAREPRTRYDTPRSRASDVPSTPAFYGRKIS